MRNSYGQIGQEIGQVGDVFEDKTVNGRLVGGLSSDWTLLARNQRLPKEVSRFGIQVWEICEECESVGFEGNRGWN